MEYPNILDFSTAEELRCWYLAHAANEAECYVVVRKKWPDEAPSMSYLEAVETALCFGWIDSVIRTLPDGRVAQRFSPRRRSGRWSELNKARCRRLERLGLMTDAGRKTLPDMSEAGFLIEKEVLAALKKEKKVWENFCSFPLLYRKVRINTVQIKKKDREVFERRLKKLVDNTREGRMFGDWNDFGRLSESDARS
jgi:hypothetical protein